MTDSAKFAEQSDPDRNRWFSRRWTDPEPGAPRELAPEAVPTPAEPDLEMTGQELLEEWRQRRRREGADCGGGA